MTGTQTFSHKERERRHLRGFQHLCPDFPPGEVIEGETPDFIVVTPAGQKIGIELTQVFKRDGKIEPAEQADEATKEFITTAARMHAECLGIPPAQVALFFNPEHLRRFKTPGRPEQRFLTKDEKDRVALNIARFVGEHMPEQGDLVDCDWSPGQPRQVDLIQINRVYPVEHHIWRWPEMRAIQHDAIEPIQSVISKKNKRYEACLCKCDECWLLAVTPPFQSIHPDQNSLSHEYASPYGRVYFYDLSFGCVFRLKAVG
jgi:hypothetical protein